MPVRRVALIGASGAVGSEVLKALVELSPLSIPPSSLTVLTRQTARDKAVPAFCPSEVRMVTVPSYTDHDAMVSALREHDVLISALNSAVLALETEIVPLAIEAGVRRFFPSEFTLDVMEPGYLHERKNPPLATQRVEWARKLHEIAATGKIEYTTIITGAFVDYCVAKSFWPFHVKERTATLFDGGNFRRWGCSLKFTGACVAAALKLPANETKNKRLRVAEVEYSGRSLVAALEEETGAQWKVSHRTLDDLKDEEQRRLDNGDAMQAYFTFVIRGDFDNEAGGRLEDGLEFCRSGDVIVPRISLRQIVADVVRQA